MRIGLSCAGLRSGLGDASSSRAIAGAERIASPGAARPCSAAIQTAQLRKIVHRALCPRMARWDLACVA